MNSGKRSLTAALITICAVGGTTLAATGEASAASYRCTTSKHSIDDPSYSGPWADNWDVTTKLCAKRSGSYVYAYAKVTWDGPVYAQCDDEGMFDKAHFKLQIKRSKSGKDPVKVSKKYYGIESRLENSDANCNYNNSYKTGTVKWKAGSAKAVADGYLALNWNSDGRGYRHTNFSSSPRA